jgi:hypothetical protein
VIAGDEIVIADVLAHGERSRSGDSVKSHADSCPNAGEHLPFPARIIFNGPSLHAPTERLRRD